MHGHKSEIWNLSRHYVNFLSNHPILSPHSKIACNTMFFESMKCKIRLVTYSDHQISSPTPSGTFMSSYTPGRDLEDRVSLDGLSLVRFWWNFQESFSMIISNKLQTLKRYKEPLCPPRVQEETWRTGWVLMGFFWSDFDDIFRKASLW